MKQDFSGEALSKQNTEASLASLSCNLSWAPTEWSAIFAFSVYWTVKEDNKINIKLFVCVVKKSLQFQEKWTKFTK